MTDEKVCVIGAGCSGITAIKNLIQAGITHVICYEQMGQIGGNWVYTTDVAHSSVCETTHLISSKKLSQYIDFPMPDNYPDYPSHHEVLQYFQSYADHFGVIPYIRFNTKVTRVEKLHTGKWQVFTDTGESEIFDHLLICNGHHSVPRHPELPGHFSGQYLHSHAYKTNAPFKGKRVLVIGAGNSGCDCAVETGRVAKHVAISLRRPHYIVPKFFLGKPTDVFNNATLWIPKKLGDMVRGWSLRLLIGGYGKYNLPDPDFAITADHPTMNSELLYSIRHGRVHPRKGIKNVQGKTVEFEDGLKEEYDVIIAATGYKIETSFFEKEFLDYSEADRIPLFLRVFHPVHARLYFIGLVQPQGAIWPLSDLQSKLVANYIAGRVKLPVNLQEWAQRDSDHIEQSFLKRKRHVIEVHFHDYVAKLKNWIPKDAPNWPGRKSHEHVK